MSSNTSQSDIKYQTTTKNQEPPPPPRPHYRQPNYHQLHPPSRQPQPKQQQQQQYQNAQSQTGGITNAGYQSFTDIGDPYQNPHLFVQHVPSGGRVTKPWQNYIGDLDDFFEKVYYYYRKGGYACIVWRAVLELIKIPFIIAFTFALLHLVDYDVLFKNKLPANHTNSTNGTPLKITIADCMLPLAQASISSFETLLLICAGAFWTLKAYQTAIAIIDFLAIRAFYVEVLQIHEPALYTWQEVQSRLVTQQSQCLISGNLDELSLHNRLLRRANYMLAMINKKVLPIFFAFPLLGEYVYLTKGLEMNFDILLFRGVFSLFERNWKIRDEVKFDRERCAKRFATRCLILGGINLALLPLIVVWQTLYAFYTYTEAIKRDPGFASSRQWSRYGRWFSRHFNELEHDLEQRLNRAHRPATRYMDSFTSPLMTVFARFATFIAGTILSVVIVLTIYDEDVITVEHVLLGMTALGGVIAISRAFLPDSEPRRYTTAELDAAILQHVHYRAHHYPAHTMQARNAVADIFAYKSTAIIEELLSPFVTPYILIFHLRSRADKIVDFFRVYTLELADLGDVCSFSLFNFRNNGHRIFNEPVTAPVGGDDGKAAAATCGISATSMGQKAEVLPDEPHTTCNGKLELSLINFKLTNPKWRPADDGQAQFIDRFIRQSNFDPALLLPNIDEATMPMGMNEIANSRSTIGWNNNIADDDDDDDDDLEHHRHHFDFENHQSTSNMATGATGQFTTPMTAEESNLVTTSQADKKNSGKSKSITGLPAASAAAAAAATTTSSMHRISMDRSIGRLSSSGHVTTTTSPAAAAGNEDYGFASKRRRLLQLRMTSMFSEQEERDNEMAVSSLFFHQIVSDMSRGGAGVSGIGSGSGSIIAAASEDEASTSVRHQTGGGRGAGAGGGGGGGSSGSGEHLPTIRRNTRISESIPLLHPSAQQHDTSRDDH